MSLMAEVVHVVHDVGASVVDVPEVAEAWIAEVQRKLSKMQAKV